MNIEKYRIKEPRGFVSKFIFYWRWHEQEVHYVNSSKDWNKLLEFVQSQCTKMNCKKYNDLGSFVYSEGKFVLSQYKQKKTVICQNLRWVKDAKVYAARLDKRYFLTDRNAVEVVKIEEETRKSYKMGAGMFAYNEMNDQFRKHYNLKSTSIYDALSGPRYEEQWTAIKNCVPKQICFIHPFAVGKIQEHCFKADVSSAFAAQTLKTTPTLHRCKTVKGVVEPNWEFPFAFYLKSHHMAIYNELDTRIDSKNFFNTDGAEMYCEVDPEEEETVLCRVSKYSLGEIFQTVYNERNSATTKDEKEKKKLTLNATIGYFQKNSSPKLSFISACVIARNNHEMITRAENLLDQGANVLYVATDSIVWQFVKTSIATTKKFLGSFTFEMKEAGRFFGQAVGAYQIEFADGTVETKCSYLENGKEKKNMPFGKLPKPKHLLGTLIDEDGKIKKI